MRYLGGKKRQSRAIVEAVQMWYLGGKKRQSRVIVEGVRAQVGGSRAGKTYVEPFCGAMWSATAMIRAFPDWDFMFSDVNPYLMCFWRKAVAGWDPPERVTEKEYCWYNERRPLDDPMTGYLGFAWSFGGKFFGGAARSNGVFKGSYGSTRDKIDALRSARVTLSCCNFASVRPPRGAVVYLDPPYEGRTAQRKDNAFCRLSYLDYAAGLVRRGHFVLATEFHNDHGWELLHDWGDTVVRHLNAKPADGTREFLMRVTS